MWEEWHDQGGQKIPRIYWCFDDLSSSTDSLSSKVVSGNRKTLRNGNSNAGNNEAWDFLFAFLIMFRHQSPFLSLLDWLTLADSVRQVRRGIEYLDPKTYAEASYYEKCLRFFGMFREEKCAFLLSCRAIMSVGYCNVDATECDGMVGMYVCTLHI